MTSAGIKKAAFSLVRRSCTVLAEAGPEAILPLDTLWKKFDEMADSIVSGMATVMRSYSSGSSGGNLHLDVYLYPNGPKMGEQIVKAYDTYKPRLG